MDTQRERILHYNLQLMLEALQFLYEECESDLAGSFQRAALQIASIFVDTYESGHRHLEPENTFRSMVGMVIDHTYSLKHKRDAEQLTEALALVVDDFLLDGIRDEITPIEWKMKIRIRLLVEGICDQLNPQEVAKFLEHVNQNIRIQPGDRRWIVKRFTALPNLASQFLPSMEIDDQIVLVNLINDMIALTEGELVHLDRQRSS